VILLPRKVDLWEKVVHRKSINLKAPVSYVDAKDIKKITGEEPRLMASMDQQEDLPSIFSVSGVFILPVTRSRYVIVKGQGYHKIEQIDSPPVEHVATLPEWELVRLPKPSIWIMPIIQDCLKDS
jgi:hypothetical protein